MWTIRVIILGTCIVGLLCVGALKTDGILDAEGYTTDPEWQQVVQNEAQPELSGILKRGFNNIQLTRKFSSADPNYHFGFDPIYLQENNNDITIRNLKTQNPITSRLRSLETDMLHNVFTLDIDLDTIVLSGFYDIINRGVLPVTNSGTIKFTLENVTANGFVGFRRNPNDCLMTSNYNLNYSVENIKIQVEYLTLNKTDPIRSELEYKDIEETLLKLFQTDLWYKVQTHVIKTNLDHVLSDISIQELFQHKKELLDRYSLRGEALDRFANRVVDGFLLRTNNLIREKGLSRIPIDNFQRSFQQSWGPVTFTGGFEAYDGHALNMSTIYRTGNFSLVHHPPSEFIAFGALGLKEFGFNYNKYKAQIWNVGPSGDIKAMARSNSVAFRMNVNGLNPGKPIYINDFDLYIEKLDDVDVQITGMGYPLNWLVSRTATWMYGLFRTRVRSTVEQTEAENESFSSTRLFVSSNSQIMADQLRTIVDQRQDINSIALSSS